MTIEECDNDWQLYDLILYLENNLDPKLQRVTESLLLSNNKKTRRRIRLWLQDRNCHWCGAETILKKHLRVFRNNYATIDHLRDRYDPERGSDFKESTVLACMKCNHKLSVERTLARPIEELWERSGRSPLLISNI